MVFSTNIFLFVFFPLFLLIYYLIPFHYKSGFILITSYIFYAWWRVDFVLLLFGVTVWSYLWSRVLLTHPERR